MYGKRKQVYNCRINRTENAIEYKVKRRKNYETTDSTTHTYRKPL